MDKNSTIFLQPIFIQKIIHARIENGFSFVKDLYNGKSGLAKFFCVKRDSIKSIILKDLTIPI